MGKKKSPTRNAASKKASKKSVPKKAMTSKAMPTANAASDKAGDDSWLTCTDYELVIVTGAAFECRFTATTGSNMKHVLDLDSEQDQPKLASDLFDALQNWPDVGIRFKSKKGSGSAPAVITEIERVHPR
jgi:hypothetical protein